MTAEPKELVTLQEQEAVVIGNLTDLARELRTGYPAGIRRILQHLRALVHALAWPAAPSLPEAAAEVHDRLVFTRAALHEFMVRLEGGAPNVDTEVANDIDRLVAALRAVKLPAPRRGTARTPQGVDELRVPNDAERRLLALVREVAAIRSDDYAPAQRTIDACVAEGWIVPISGIGEPVRLTALGERALASAERLRLN